MTANTKTPLQAVVSVICDCLADLPVDDQARALEAARVTLGLRSPVAPPPARDRSVYQDAPVPAPPLVQVEMMSGAPMVVSPPMAQPGRALVMIGPQQSGRSLRQLSAPRMPARGYVRALR